MTWGGVGGVVGFLISLLGALAGVIAAGFVGASCGRRAAGASEKASTPGDGAVAGLVSGLVAAPVFMLGAASGALVSARRVGAEKIAGLLSDAAGVRVSPGEAWQIFLVSLVIAAILQAVLLILTAVAAGAWATRNSSSR